MKKGFDYAIKNNFFDKQDFLALKNQLTTLEYVPPKQTDVERMLNHVYWHQREVQNNSEVADLIAKKIKQYFNFVVEEYTHIYFTMCGNQPTLHPHVDLTDTVKYQCLIYIAGPTDLYSGTGIFKKENTVLENMEQGPVDVIGFKENKAIFWDSNVIHCPAQTENTGTWRYSIATMFR
tara:strand:- start:3642 stop:4175 length:534 start_codon:yes stop_codon:yes gene_type:complete